MGFSIGQKDYRKRTLKIQNEINVTPFVDVMLVLLVIFMVTSPMLISGVEVNLPKSESTPIAGQDEPIAISVDHNGNVYLQDKKVDIITLGSKLKALLRERSEVRIFVRGDHRISYGKIMEVFNILQSAGYHNIALVTEIETK